MVGRGSIIGYTVLFRNNDAVRAVAVCDLPDGKRTVVYSEQASVLQRMMTEEFCGQLVSLEGGQFSL